MTPGPDGAPSVANLRARVVARIMDLGGDEALAARIADFVASAASGRREDLEADPEVWGRLEELGVSLAVRRLRAQRRRTSPELAGVAAGTEGEVEADPDAVLAALEAVPLRERMLLELVYIESYDIGDAAEFFNLPEASVERLLGRARRRLRREYQRRNRGHLGAVGLAMDAARRTRAVMGRAAGEWVGTVVQWAQLNPFRAGVGSTVAVLSVAAVLAGAQKLPTVPSLTGAPVVVEAPQKAPPGSSAPVDRQPGASAAASDPVSRPAVVQRPRPILVDRVVEESPTGTQTRYRIETTKPTTTPESEPSSRRDEDRLVDAFIFVDCPPPNERALHEAALCLVVAP